MKSIRTDRWIFVALVCVSLMGRLLKVWAPDDTASTLTDLIAPMFSDVLICFGGVGSAGLLCIALFGPASVERTHFWVFLAGIVGAAILFVCRI